MTALIWKKNLRIRKMPPTAAANKNCQRSVPDPGSTYAQAFEEEAHSSINRAKTGILNALLFMVKLQGRRHPLESCEPARIADGNSRTDGGKNPWKWRKPSEPKTE